MYCCQLSGMTTPSPARASLSQRGSALWRAASKPASSRVRSSCPSTWMRCQPKSVWTGPTVSAHRGGKGGLLERLDHGAPARTSPDPRPGPCWTCPAKARRPALPALGARRGLLQDVWATASLCDQDVPGVHLLLLPRDLGLHRLVEARAVQRASILRAEVGFADVGGLQPVRYSPRSRLESVLAVGRRRRLRCRAGPGCRRARWAPCRRDRRAGARGRCQCRRGRCPSPGAWRLAGAWVCRSGRSRRQPRWPR